MSGLVLAWFHLIFTFVLLIHLEFILVYTVNNESNFLFPHMATQSGVLELAHASSQEWIFFNFQEFHELIAKHSHKYKINYTNVQ